MPDLFFSAPWGHHTYLVMLKTYNYVVLGWNTTSTSIFLVQPTNMWQILHRKGKGDYT